MTATEWAGRLAQLPNDLEWQRVLLAVQLVVCPRAPQCVWRHARREATGSVVAAGSSLSNGDPGADRAPLDQLGDHLGARLPTVAGEDHIGGLLVEERGG